MPACSRSYMKVCEHLWHATASELYDHPEYWVILQACCRPTELQVEADGGKRHIRAVAFVSAPEMHVAEGLPPPDRWAHLAAPLGEQSGVMFSS